MWLTAAIVVVFFLAIVASLAALARHAPMLWTESVEKARGGSAVDYAGSSTGSAEPVPAQQHQAEPELVPNFTRALAYISQHNFTSDEATDVLASIKVGEDYLLSANKIRDIVGGNEAAVKARVAARRPKAEPPKPSARLERPANGWG